MRLGSVGSAAAGLPCDHSLLRCTDLCPIALPTDICVRLPPCRRPAPPCRSGADPSVLGVTVLAWGNSLMDFVNNTGLAERSRGGNSRAMTACFAGPLFNMLVGLGLGFWALLAEAHEVRAAVEMDPVVLAGCLFILLNCGGLVGVSLAHRQRLPGWCGWAMVGCYAAYLATVLALVVAL